MPRMSRRKKANRIIKKEVLKSCLIAVLIGATGTIGSFAYFSSSAKVESNLIVKMGIVDIGFNKKEKLININDLVPSGNSNISKISGKSEFKIKNTGSLNQKGEIYFSDKNSELPDEVLSGINYEIIFRDENKNQIGKIKKGNLKDLMDGKKIVISDNIGKPIILGNGKEITCDFQAILTKSIDAKYRNKTIKFTVNGKAVQANNPNGLN